MAMRAVDVEIGARARVERRGRGAPIGVARDAHRGHPGEIAERDQSLELVDLVARAGERPVAMPRLQPERLDRAGGVLERLATWPPVARCAPRVPNGWVPL